MSKPFAPDILTWSKADLSPNPLVEGLCQQGVKTEATSCGAQTSEVDLAMTLMLMTARRCAPAARDVANNWWDADSGLSNEAGLLEGKTLGLVGCTAATLELARRAHFGFGMNIIIQDVDVIPTDVLVECRAEHVATLEDLLPRCDVVSLHCASAPSRHVMTGPMLDLMKPTAVLINAGDETLVNEHALSQALMFDTIGGAGLAIAAHDRPKSHALRQCDTVVLLPRSHAA